MMNHRHHSANSSNAHHSYQDVPSNEEEPDDELSNNIYEEEEDNGDEEHQLHEASSPSRRRKIRAPPTTGIPTNGMLCMLGYVLFALVVTSVALVGWKAAEQKTSRVVGVLPEDDDDDDDVFANKQGMVLPSPTKPKSVIHYDPSVALHPLNPFDLQETDSSSLVQPPILPSYRDQSDETDSSLGYMMQPHVVNNTLVFVSEGDLYLSRITKQQQEYHTAMKLTTTVGNVLHPRINPVYPYYVAYTATYTGRRELYLVDLRVPKRTAMRLTYWDHAYGVSRVVGWKDDGMTIVFAAASTDIGMPDTRMYQLSLEQVGHDDNDSRRELHHLPLRVWQAQPIPLYQALDGVFADDCVYFVRFAQSSNTIRYVGGTAESLWAWCYERKTAVPLTTNYKGTDKSPSIVKYKGQAYLFFMSDRLHAEGGEQAGSMNLWATPLLTQQDLYNSNKGNSTTDTTPKYIQLTQVSCDFDGKPLVEYAVDTVTHNVVLRIGADLHIVKASVIQEKLTGTVKKKETKQKDKDGNDNRRLASKEIAGLPTAVYSDFHEHQERLIPVSLPKDVTSVDVYQTAFGGILTLLGLRGQLFVTPTIGDVEQAHPYAGAGMNLPPRRYRVAPGIAAGGSVRIQAAKYVPLKLEKDARRLALVLATDPKSSTAEHAFYLLETQSDAPQTFVDVKALPDPFLGGSLNGGSVADGGLGTVEEDSVTVSPCGRRFAWTDKDGRICVMTMPVYQNETSAPYPYQVLPQENEQGQSMIGTEADLSWSPGGRYLAVRHEARNQFDVISIVDCGVPDDGALNIGRIVQATSDRFNSHHMYWGKTALDFQVQKQQEALAKLTGKPMESSNGATVLYYLSDRDLVGDVQSPWGTRQPSPHFPPRYNVYALPLVAEKDQRGPLTSTRGTFPGGGASELWVDNILALQEFLESAAAIDKEKKPGRHLFEAAEKDKSKDTKTKTETEAAIVEDDTTLETADVKAKDETNLTATIEIEKPSPFPQDCEINFGDASKDLAFARRAYRVGNIPEGSYSAISQPADDPSIVVIEKTAADKSIIKIFSVGDFPSDAIEPLTVELEPPLQLAAFSLSTTREYFVLFFAPGGRMKIVPNSAAGLVALIQDKKATKNIADTDELALSVWPALEYQQMYDDAWRMLRDYFYDPNMHGVDWPAIHARYRPLVKRCAKREELDDVLKQMASELSALHVFVYGGEYRSPTHGSKLLDFVHETASLGSTLMRSAEWKGYVVTSIPERDPDFNLVDGKPMYSPLSNRTLQHSGQRGLAVGDVIVAVNGESVMRVPDIHMLLRGTRGRSVRLEVLRLASGASEKIEIALPKTNQTRRKLDDDGGTDDEATTPSTKASSSDIALAPEPLITVPISLSDAAELRYAAWEYQTRETAKRLAHDAGFTVGYVHLQSMMGPKDIDAFFRGFYPDYNKEALIMDVRHNHGGNIDSWLLDVLQRQAWMYWQSRTKNITTGGLGWDEHFAFRGHIVVLIDEHTSSDGEGFSRGVSELGLGKLVGKRTWGGGIWLSSDNHLVDGGIATAPEVGTYNDKFGWGLGIEQMGVEPDYEVDNDPRVFYDGKDQQLEHAIDVLRRWIKKEPIVLPKNPGPHPIRSAPKQVEEDCPAR